MSENARAPGVMEMLAQSLLALVRPSTFRSLAERPAPSTAACFSLATAASAVWLAVLARHWGWFDPSLQGRIRMDLKFGGIAAYFAVQGALLLLGTALLPRLARALGGESGADRGPQAAAMISVFGSAWMTSHLFPGLWMAPTLASAWLTVGALRGLFGARSWSSHAAVGIAAFVVLTIQSGMRRGWAEVDHRNQIRQIEFGAAFARADITRGLENFGPHVSTASPSGAQPISSLELVRALRDDRPQLPPADDAVSPPAPAVPSDVRESAARFLEATAPRLDDPRLLKDLTPEQKANVNDARRLIEDLHARVKSGQGLDDPEFAREMMRYQQRMMKFMDGQAAKPSVGDPQ